MGTWALLLRRRCSQFPPHLHPRSQGVHCVAYSPLGVGKEALLQHPAVLEVAAETGKTPAQVWHRRLIV